MIKFILNHIPRGVLQKLAGLGMPLVRAYYAVGRGGEFSGRSECSGGSGRGASRRDGSDGSGSSDGSGGSGGSGRGGGVQCPLCGARYRKFMPYGYVEVRKNALCPKCLALERHRLLWLWLERETELTQSTAGSASGQAWGLCESPLSASGREVAQEPSHREAQEPSHREAQEPSHREEREVVQEPSHREAQDVAQEPSHRERTERDRKQFRFLHIAPEVCLMRKFERAFPDESYVTADLESPLAKVKMDVQAMPFEDGEFDVVFCNHVLEHVADDRLAMREMWRVMRRGGWGVMLSPVDEERATTFEDDTITDPDERTRVFGQYDHRRIYGRDYADRLRGEGFEVEETDYFDRLTAQEQARYGLRREVLYVVRKS